MLSPANFKHYVIEVAKYIHRTDGAQRRGVRNIEVSVVTRRCNVLSVN